MLKFLKIQCLYNANVPVKPLQTLTPPLLIYGYHHFTSKSNSSLDFAQRVDENSVGIFWDLYNKPPRFYPPYAVAIRLTKAAEHFGFVKHKIAYANSHSFSYVPPKIREMRKVRRGVNELENLGVINPVVPYLCKVCGRRFMNNEKFINHFKQIHEREHVKRLNQIESARGSTRVKLIGKYSTKMEKYKNAARDVLTPKVGYGLDDELKRAGFLVRKVSDKPQTADVELRNHMVDMMDHRRIECVVLVSDDSDFVGVLEEAKLRCLKTVVVGDGYDGALKRVADASFSWKEIMMGKANDRDVLRSLESTNNREIDKKRYYSETDSNLLSEDSDVEGFLSGEDDDVLTRNEDAFAWWEIKSDTADSSL